MIPAGLLFGGHQIQVSPQTKITMQRRQGGGGWFGGIGNAVNIGLPSHLTDRLISLVLMTGGILGSVALFLLALRAMLRIETRFDAFYYHIPIAARRAGLSVPYEMPPFVQHLYEGYPPLPEFLQGVLWRITGSLNATGMINILSLAIFIYYCHTKLKAPFSVVVVLCLTTPMVIIHAASNYVDLFSNGLLAIATTSLLAMIVFDRWTDRSLLCWGLAGLAGAAWSKVLLAPPAFLVCSVYFGVYLRRVRLPGYPQLLRFVVGAAVLASVPYVKNLIVYHNPVWPLQVPVAGGLFPYTFETSHSHDEESPPPLIKLSEGELFVRSVLEIQHPTEYSWRERWLIDQGNGWIDYRSGGYWKVAVITMMTAAVLLGFLFSARKGWMLLGSIAAMWWFVALLPAAHDLRYYQFLPLTMSATIGMLLPRIRRVWPALVLVLLVIFLAEFAWMARVNRNYYRVERADYRSVAEYWGAARWWPSLRAGETYCAVGFYHAILLTGPTMKEFHIIDQPKVELCPPNTRVLREVTQ